jgi:hypothetical protein
MKPGGGGHRSLQSCQNDPPLTGDLPLPFASPTSHNSLCSPILHPTLGIGTWNLSVTNSYRVTSPRIAQR